MRTPGPSHFHLPLIAATLLFAAVAPAQGIRWTPDFAEALQRAKAERKVVMLAFNMAGERANEELLNDHYKDSTLGKLSQHSINVFCSQSPQGCVPGVSAAQQQAAETTARLQVLKIGPGEDVIAPQHVFLDPDGAILSSIAWRLTKGELEWSWVDAIRKVDPEFAWQLSNGARAPGKLGFGNVERGRNEKPPTKAEVDEALKEVKKSRGNLWRNLREFGVLLRSDQTEAMAFITSTLNGLPDRAVIGAIDTMGYSSPKAYHGVVAPYLSNRDEEVRYAAAAAMEQFAEPKALPPLLKQWKEEKVERVRGRLLRAMASSAPTNKEVVNQIDKLLAKEASPDLRAMAVLAAALLEDRNKVHDLLAAALRDSSAKVRATAGFALASRREADFALRVEEAASREEDAETKAWLEEAGKVIRGGPIDPFKNFLERVLGEQPRRAGQALEGLGGLGGGRGGGPGGGGPGGGGPGGGRGR